MATLPQLYEEDIQSMEQCLSGLLAVSEAHAGLLIDKGGFHIAAQGQLDDLDTTTLAAMASASYAATQQIAALVRENDFDSVYQQGELQSIFIRNVDPYALLVVVFSARHGVGVIKYYVEEVIEKISGIFQSAYERDPEEGLDLSMMNMADTSAVFRKKA